MNRLPLLRVPGIRALSILWRLLLPLGIGTFVVVVARVFALSPELQQQSYAVFFFLLGYGFLLALVDEILAPFRPKLRLLPISDAGARRLATVTKLLLLLLLGGELAIYLLETNRAHPALAALIRLVRDAGLILVTWLVLHSSGLLQRLVPEEVDTAWKLVLKWAIQFFLPLAVLTALAFVTLRALGYIGFAQWLIGRAEWSAMAILFVVLAHWWISLWTGRAMRFMQNVEVEASQEHGTVHDAEGAKWMAVDRIVRLLLGIAATIFAGFLVLVIWGIGADDLAAVLVKPIAPGRQLTWMDLLDGALQVGIVLLAGRILRDYLVFAVFPRRNTEVGVRYATVTFLKYVVILIAVLVGASAIGLNASAVAVFAGGAGVGLSFALKDILGNFFSGLILLSGETVRVGDIVEVSGVQGKVEAIRLRATVIRAWDGNAVVIPNEQMIGERLTKQPVVKVARLEVPVGVSYGSDLERVEQILLREARTMDGVLSEPEAYVVVTGFGNSSVDFQLDCFTDRTDDRVHLQHDLRKSVFAAFRREGIEIPFPQRDLHLRSDDRLALKGES